MLPLDISMRLLWRQRQFGQRAWPPNLLMSDVLAKSAETRVRRPPVSPPPFEALDAGVEYMQFQKPTGTGMKSIASLKPPVPAAVALDTCDAVFAAASLLKYW
jgi:hypothetical protein